MTGASVISPMSPMISTPASGSAARQRLGQSGAQLSGLDRPGEQEVDPVTTHAGECGGSRSAVQRARTVTALERVPLFNVRTTFGAFFNRLTDLRRNSALPVPLTGLADLVPCSRAVPLNVAVGAMVLIVQVIELRVAGEVAGHAHVERVALLSPFGP